MSTKGPDTPIVIVGNKSDAVRELDKVTGSEYSSYRYSHRDVYVVQLYSTNIMDKPVQSGR